MRLDPHFVFPLDILSLTVGFSPPLYLDIIFFSWLSIFFGHFFLPSAPPRYTSMRWFLPKAGKSPPGLRNGFAYILDYFFWCLNGNLDLSFFSSPLFPSLGLCFVIGLTSISSWASFNR